MNALLNHTWGKSPAADRVWSMVTGMRPNDAVRQPLMVFQAFIDDSYTPDGELVLAGFVATAEAWANFSKEWEALLPKGGTLAKNGIYHFKMSEMAASPERMERVPAFWWIIQKYMDVAISCRINIAELRRARNRLYIPAADVDWGFWGNSYLAASRILLDMFHANRGELSSRIPLSDPVDFIFDEQTEKAVILEAWARYIKNRSEDVRHLYGSTPRFENDQRFLPLQAADLWAWWVREWSEAGKLPNAFATLDFGKWQGRRGMHGIIAHYSYNEEQFVADMKKGTREMIGPSPIIYDITFSPFSPKG